jgi:hypothetical protein
MLDVRSSPKADVRQLAGNVGFGPKRRLMQRSNHRLIQLPELGQNDLKFRSRARRTIKIEPAAQSVRYDVVEDMQAKACTA